MDRLQSVHYDATGGGPTISYTYDDNGNITSVTDATGKTTFQYDEDNRQIQKTLPGGTTIKTAFDPVGNLTSLTGPDGTTTYAYNNVNLLSTLTEPGGAKTTFQYDNAYHRTQTSYPNGVTLTMGYDGAGRITSITSKNSSGTLTSFSYSYTTPGGNKTELRQSATDTNGNVSTYSYDSLNRLTQVQTKNSGGTLIGEEQYAYDGAGNRTSATLTLGGPQITYLYNTANELTSSSQVSSYTYNTGGNLTSSSGGPQYSYNAIHQTVQIGSTTFAYTGPNQTERVQENNTTFTYSGLGCDCQNDASGTTYYTHDNSGQLIDERTPSGTYYYLFDGLGSVIGLTDSSGNLVNNETYQYDSYGNLQHAPSSSVLQSNPWLYASGYYDTSTGLYKFGIRYYDPTTGRWTQRDPVGASLQELTDANAYMYANDDPVNLIDPSGALTCGGNKAVFIASAVLLGAGTVVAVAAAGALTAGAGLALAGAAIGAASGVLGWVAGPADAVSTTCNNKPLF